MPLIGSVARCSVATSVALVFIAWSVISLRQHPPRGRDAVGSADRWGAPSAGAPSRWQLSRAVIRSQIDHGRFTLLVIRGDDGLRGDSLFARDDSALIVSHLRDPPSIIVGELLTWADATRAFPSLFGNSSDSGHVAARPPASLSSGSQRRHAPKSSLGRQPQHKNPPHRQRGLLNTLLSVTGMNVKATGTTDSEESKGHRSSKSRRHHPSLPGKTALPHAFPGSDGLGAEPQHSLACHFDTISWRAALLETPAPVCPTVSPTPAPPRSAWSSTVARCTAQNPEGHFEAVLILYAARGVTTQTGRTPTVAPPPRPWQVGAWPACLEAVASLTTIPDESLRSAVVSLARRRLADIVFVQGPGDTSLQFSRETKATAKHV